MCVCVSVSTMFIYPCGDQNLNVTILVRTNSSIWGQIARPHKFEGMSETQNVVIVSGLQLD